MCKQPRNPHAEKRMERVSLGSALEMSPLCSVQVNILWCFMQSSKTLDSTLILVLANMPYFVILCLLRYVFLPQHIVNFFPSGTIPSPLSHVFYNSQHRTECVYRKERKEGCRGETEKDIEVEKVIDVDVDVDSEGEGEGKGDVDVGMYLKQK